MVYRNTVGFESWQTIAGPAILTNACSVLALSTNNRLGRVIDRSRLLFREIDAMEPPAARQVAQQKMIEALDVRAQLLLKALRCFYASPGLFAAAALMSALGSVFEFRLHYYGSRNTAGRATTRGRGDDAVYSKSPVVTHRLFRFDWNSSCFFAANEKTREEKSACTYLTEVSDAR